MATVRFQTPLPNKRPSYKLECHIVLLDNFDFVALFEKKSAKGQELFDRACEKLKIPSNEKGFFGLQFTDRADGELNWVDMKREIRAQRSKPYNFQFAVRFFPARNYSRLSRETQNQIRLQVKDYLVRGKFVCTVNEHAMLDGFFAQAMLGDFQRPVHSKGYLEDLLGPFFAPPNGINSEIEVSESEYELSVANNHRSHRGMSLEEANLAYLELAKNLPFFGTSFHPGATDKNGNSVLLAIDSQGLLIYECDGLNKPGEVTSRFPWSDIVSLVSQNRKFYIVAYSSEKKDGGSFSFRFHGHYAHRGADRMRTDALEWQAFYYKPEKKLNRRSKSFGEADSIATITAREEAKENFERSERRYGTVVRKRPGTSFKRFKSSLRKKLPRRFKPSRLQDQTVFASSSSSSAASTNETFESSILHQNEHKICAVTSNL